MNGGNASPQGHAAIDAALQQWRQGDCVLSSQWFVVRGDPSTTSPVPDPDELIEADIAGFAVLSQTCDIVRSSRDRPYVEVCPLVVSHALADVKAGRRPSYAHLPGVESHGLVADLDRTMTLTKNALVGLPRICGCPTEADGRALSRALKRKRGRFAFPDDFNALCEALKKRLVEKHDKQSLEGAALRRLREIRVEAVPAWDADSVQVMFWFIRESGDASAEWHQQLAAWLRLVPADGRFISVEGQVATLEEMTAAEYVLSERLDLDHLSRTA